MATQIGIKKRLELLSKKSHLSNIPTLIYKGYTICKAVYVDGKNTLNSTTHEYWYVEEAKDIINDVEHCIFYKYELYDNIPNALNYVDKKTFKPYTKSKKWLG